MGGDLFGNWSLEDRLVDLLAGQVRISRRAEPFSVLLFLHEDGSFRGWYVNLERPQQRTAPQVAGLHQRGTGDPQRQPTGPQRHHE